MFSYNYLIFTETKLVFQIKKCEELCLKETVQEGGFKIIPRLLYSTCLASRPYFKARALNNGKEYYSL